MNQQTARMIAEAHDRITRRKGKEYSPTPTEIENEINKSLTAVEWLFNKMTENGTNPYWDMRFIQAKQMERDQREKDYDEGWDKGYEEGYRDGNK